MKIVTCSFLFLFLFQPLSTLGNDFAKTDITAAPGDTVSVPPANVRCGDGKLGYGLYWMDNSTNEVKFKVYRAVNSTNDFSDWYEVKSNTQTTKARSTSVK